MSGRQKPADFTFTPTSVNDAVREREQLAREYQELCSKLEEDGHTGKLRWQAKNDLLMRTDWVNARLGFLKNWLRPQLSRFEFNTFSGSPPTDEELLNAAHTLIKRLMQHCSEQQLYPEERAALRLLRMRMEKKT